MRTEQQLTYEDTNYLRTVDKQACDSIVGAAG